jgi:HSP20 family protein
MQNTADDRSWDVDKLFENFFNDAVFPSFYTRSGFMRVDIRETDDSFLLEAELPGVSREQVNIDLDGDNLTIMVNQDESNEDKNERYLRRERRCCSMARSFNVENIDAEKIAAKMENGILKLTLPKKEPTRKLNRKIDIG